MGKNINHYILLLILLLFELSAIAQVRDTNTSIVNKVKLYDAKIRAPTLFVHFDKTVYVPNESIWFTAYLLNGGQNVKENNILSVSLVKSNTHKVITTQKFVMAEGISSGSMELPDSIPPGNYSLMAYTNVLNNDIPLDIFQQSITIKTTDVLLVKKIKAETKTLPLTQRKYLVKFYPEGGNMINKLMGRVGWEVKDNTGKPVNTSGVLFEDDKPLDTVTTSGFGIGSFYLKPESSRHYSLKLIGSELVDTSYLLPIIYPYGATAFVSNAVATDTLTLRVAKDNPGKLFLVIHNYKEVFFSLPIITTEHGRIVKVPLNTVPKGLAAVTILNEQEKPLAECIFFAHYDSKQQLNINTDQQDYGTRKKITLHLKLNNPNTSSAFVSVAVVQGNRVEELKKNNIVNYYYLQHDLENLPYKESYFGGSNDDKQFLENILLIKGWRRYKWEELDKVRLTDTERHFTTPSFIGNVTKENGKPVDKKTPLTLFSDSSAHVIISDQDGHFVIKPEYLAVSADKQPYFLLQVNTAINFTDPFKNIDQSVANHIDSETKQIAINDQSIDAFKLTGFEHSKKLKEVVITSKNDNNLYGASKKGTNLVNDCGDYVCQYGVLNCTTHPGGGKPAVKGVYYIHQTINFDGTTGGYKVLYTGCETFNRRLKQKFVTAIQMPKEFYGFDPILLSDPTPEYLSSIYWNNLIKINNDSDTAITFYSGDVTGEFKIIVQGVSNSDVVYGAMNFFIKK